MHLELNCSQRLYFCNFKNFVNSNYEYQMYLYLHKIYKQCLLRFNSTIGVLCVCGNSLYPLLDIWGHLGIHVRHSVLEGVLGVSKTTHTDSCKPSNIYKQFLRKSIIYRYIDNLPYSWTWRALPESPFRIPAILSS